MLQKKIKRKNRCNMVYIDMIRTLIREYRKDYRKYKKLKEDDRYVFRSLLWYYAYLFLMIPCFFLFMDGKGYLFLIFIVLCLIMIIRELKYLFSNREQLGRMSIKLKYSMQHIFISLIKTFNCED